MDIVAAASFLPRPVLKHGFGVFIALQQARDDNQFRSNWKEYEWEYVYDDPASLTFFFDAKVTNGKTGREEIPMEYFANLGEDHDSMFDLGAHMGSVAVILGTLNSNLPLYCFEPIRSNVRTLRQNLAANNIDAEIHEAVVGTENGSVTFYEQSGGKTRKLHMFDDTVAHSSSEAYAADPDFEPVEKESLDLLEFCEDEGITRPFLKIDIEGSEHALMDELLHSDHGLDGFSAVVELHPDLIDDGNAHDIVLWLEEESIDIEWVKTRNPRRMALYCSTL